MLTASTSSRTITGLIAPYNSHGRTSAGLVKIKAGAIRLPADLTKIKLLNFHSNEVGGVAESIGYAISAEDTPAGLVMSFRIANTAEGDKALQAAQERVKDGLSVELSGVKMHRDEVTDAELNAVAHVPMPAYDESRISHIAAQAHYEHTHDHLTQGENTMSEEIENEVAEVTEEVTPDTAEVVEEVVEEDKEPALTAARIPATMLSATHRPAKDSKSLDGLFATVAELNTMGRSPELTAALEDIAYSASPWADRPSYAGELWSGVPFDRKFVPLLTQRTLNSLKVQGWRWVTPPEMSAYAGDKAAITSTAVEVEDVTTTATRLAGGNDIDRAYWDFGNREFIESYYRKQAESYSKKSDALALAFILASATGATAVTTFLEAASVAIEEVEDETGTPATFVLVNPADRRTLLATPSSDIPAFLSVLGIDPKSFIASSSVAAGSVIAGTKSAAAFYELGSTPIRVDAVNIANGGNDIGVFGYTANLLEHPTGIREVTFGA